MNLSAAAKACIRRLGLKKHPEGGYYRETYRSEEAVAPKALPGRYAQKRSFSTAIYYLLPQGEFSALHRLKSDELWHFYAGAALTLVTLSPQGRWTQVRLGPDLAKGERPQILIRRATWFGGAPGSGRGKDFTLMGCTVAPGFDFADFEMAQRADLLKKFPARRRLILQWTR